MIQGVIAEPRYIYTIGLSRFDLPEIMMVGRFSTSTLGLPLVNHIGHLMHVHGIRFVDAENSNKFFENVPVHFRELADTSIRQHCGMLFNLLGESDYRLLQVMLPDRQLRMPWEIDSGVPDQLELNLVYKTPIIRYLH